MSFTSSLHEKEGQGSILYYSTKSAPLVLEGWTSPVQVRFSTVNAIYSACYAVRGIPAVGATEQVNELMCDDQKLLEAQGRMEAIEGIKRGLESMKRNAGKPADEFFSEFFR